MRPDGTQRVIRRRAQVDGGDAAARRGSPRRLEELLAGGNQVMCAAADSFGIAHEDHCLGRKQVDEQFHVVDQRGH